MSIFATTNIFIDKYHPGIGGKCAISIKVTYNRKRKYFLTPYKLTVGEFDALFKQNIREKNKVVLSVLLRTETKAKEIIDGLGQNFTFESFTKKFTRKSGDHENLFHLLAQRAIELKRDGRISTAVTFECTLSSLKRFYPNQKLLLQDVNISFLKEYQLWMEANENSHATIGIYLRNVRTLFNEAEDDGIIPKELYPFRRKANEKGKYVIPTGANIKKALKLDEVASIFNYNPSTESQRKARDFWLFTYLANGINVKDIALLKLKNVKGDFIKFQRAKTLRENVNKPIIITIPLVKETKDIISRWGNKSVVAEDYLFPILNRNSSTQEQYDLIQLFTSFINDHMKEIAKILKINAAVTSYTARHSFATIMKNSGVNVVAIGEALGHKSLATTQNYLAGFEDEAKMKNAKVLTDFGPTNNL